jgi:hypothetical protein
MSDFDFSVAFEVKTPRKALLGGFTEVKGFDQGSVEQTVARLLGVNLRCPRVVRDHWRHANPERLHESLRSIRLVRLSGRTSVVCLSFGLEIQKIEQAKGLRLFSSPAVKRIFLSLGLHAAETTSVSAIASSVCPEGLDINTSVVDGWLNLKPQPKSDYFWSAIVTELAIRVAIERVLVQRFIGIRSATNLNIFSIPIAAFRIRRWPVALLPDKTQARDLFLELRDSINLPSARSETLEHARTWWAAFGSLVGILAFGSALVSVVMELK